MPVFTSNTSKPGSYPLEITAPTLAALADALAGGAFPLRFTAYDGSSTGPANTQLGLHLKSRRGATFLATAPGQLGLVRAYVSGDLDGLGVHPGDPYPLLHALAEVAWKRPDAGDVLRAARFLGWDVLKPAAPPALEVRPRWRRITAGLSHSRQRDADAIHHHYDVSSQFYRYILGPSMAYTCAVYPGPDSTLEEAQENKYRLIFDKLNLKAGDRLLDIGCGWGSMVRYAARRGVQAVGVTLAAEQARWAQDAIAAEGLSASAEIRFSDYRNVPDTGFDAICSMGMTEHIGRKQYPTYFGFFYEKLRPGGLMLNHCVTRADSKTRATGGALTDRYVFPDGELAGSGQIVAEIENTGLEVLHHENLRPHYVATLRDWCRNLVDHWDDAVDEVDEQTARMWGLFMAGGRVQLERNQVQLHQVLAVKNAAQGVNQLPLGPWWLR